MISLGQKIVAVGRGYSVSDTTAEQNDVRIGKVFVNSSGEYKTGVLIPSGGASYSFHYPLSSNLTDIYFISGFIDNKFEAKSNLNTDVSALGFIKSYTETDPIFTSVSSSLALKSQIPTNISQLTNDKGYISSYTETDPIYSAQKNSLALKSQIPTNISQLTNDKGYISSYTETDPIFSANSGIFALKTDIKDLTLSDDLATTIPNSFIANFNLSSSIQRYSTMSATATSISIDKLDSTTTSDTKCPTIELHIPLNGNISTINLGSSLQNINIPTEIEILPSYSYTYAVFVIRKIGSTYMISYSYKYGE